jgi:hypothetical protein
MLGYRPEPTDVGDELEDGRSFVVRQERPLFGRPDLDPTESLPEHATEQMGPARSECGLVKVVVSRHDGNSRCSFVRSARATSIGSRHVADARSTASGA